MTSSLLTNNSLYVGKPNAHATPLGTVNIYESTGSSESATTGTVFLQHDSGSSSIVFPSKTNFTSDYGYIEYSGTSNYLNIGTENDNGAIDTINDQLIFQPKVAIGTSTPYSLSALDVSGVILSKLISYNPSTYAFNNAYDIRWEGNQAKLYIDNGAAIILLTLIQSDYRIKKNVNVSTQSALTKIMKIRTVTYNFINNNFEKEGFIAHELAEIIPSAVNNKKDDPDEMQSLRLDALCSILVKALQEQDLQIESLQKQIMSAYETLANYGI